MKNTTEKIYNELFDRYKALNVCKTEIKTAFDILLETYNKGGKLLVCGNGGSASDSEHIVGELIKSFKKKRPVPQEFCNKLNAYEDGERLGKMLEGGLPAISLTSHIALSTAYANDNEPKCVFAQQLYVLGNTCDAFMAISTSGNSQNCVYAAEVAKAKGLKVISLTGQKESKLSALSDVTVKVSETETYKVQELHLPVYHAICAMLEEELF